MRRIRWGRRSLADVLADGLQRVRPRRRWLWAGEPLLTATGRALRTAAAQRWYRRCALLVALAIVLALVLPAAALLRVEDAIGTLLPWLRGVSSGAPYGDKLAHFSLFAVWAATLQLGWPEASRGSLFAKVAAVAAGTELLQLLVPGRTASVADLAADLAGGALVFAVVYLRRQAGVMRG